MAGVIFFGFMINALGELLSHAGQTARRASLLHNKIQVKVPADGDTLVYLFLPCFSRLFTKLAWMSLRGVGLWLCCYAEQLYLIKLDLNVHIQKQSCVKPWIYESETLLDPRLLTHELGRSCGPLLTYLNMKHPHGQRRCEQRSSACWKRRLQSLAEAYVT